MSVETCDLVIIGAGPGGYVAAIHAAQSGLKTALIEARELGGVCLQAGCIPTKAMLACADVLRACRSASQFGIQVAGIESSLPAMLARQKKVVQQFTQGLKYLLEKNQVEILRGQAAFVSPAELVVRDASGAVARHLPRPASVILATGSRPIDLAVAKRDGSRILNSGDLLNLAEIPKSLAIIGGGYIGCEFASLYAALGCQVTIIEALDRLLPNMDKELGQTLARSFTKAGIRLIFNTKVARTEAAHEVRLSLSDGQTVVSEKALAAVGRQPNVEDLGLDAAGIQWNRQGILIDSQLQTNVPGIYAIGDVTGKMALAHVASAQGRWLVRRLAATRLGGTEEIARDPLAYDAIPGCVFTYPEVASVGLSEDQARQQGLDIKIGRFPFSVAGKAVAMGETEGFVKLVADAATGRLLGGHILGPHAAELIATVALALRWNLTATQVAETVFAHPTLSETIFEASESVFGKPTHIYTRR